MPQPSPKDPDFQVRLAADPPTYLYADRLRDGRVALGTRVLDGDEWVPGELQILDRTAYLALAGWLSQAVEDTWLDAVRARQDEPLQTARELYGEGPGGVEQLAIDMLREIPPVLLVRGLLLLVNSVGPEARERLVGRLNATLNRLEDSTLRRQLAEESAAVAYGVAAAALLDALEHGTFE